MAACKCHRILSQAEYQQDSYVLNGAAEHVLSE